ncbi:MAG: GNAT family N-acetyltransferase [Actinobacteria bacterium]|nr:MAG: GNAT family N-acetyltransferase [Actinomycetota bacterium]
MKLRAGTRDDLPAVWAMLDGAGLPTTGVDPADLTLLVADEGGVAVGAAAVEAHSSHGLLRSVVVDPELRRRSLGTALVAAAVAEAEDAGLDDLWLLTETAEGFFSSHGWQRMTAADLPAAVRLSPEYTAHCSDSAVVMVRELRRP